MALKCWALALRLKAHATTGYPLFGGLWGACTHLWAVTRGIVTKPPMLQGASPMGAVVIAFFEFTFYWCVILGASALVTWGWGFLGTESDNVGRIGNSPHS
jgi:hypothetical protein